MELSNWYKFRRSEVFEQGYDSVGKPSKEKRKVKRENDNMSKSRGPDKAGIWTEPGLLSYVDGENLNKLGTAISTAMFILRADPNPANHDAMVDALNKFRAVWQPLHDKRVDTGSQQTLPQQQTASKRK